MAVPDEADSIGATTMLAELLRSSTGEPSSTGTLRRRTVRDLVEMLVNALGERPAVLVLDNVTGTDQIRWVSQLPTTIPVIVTSRRRLRPAGFEAIHLEPLDGHASTALLQALVEDSHQPDGSTDSCSGRHGQRTTSDLAELAVLSGGLPLTLAAIAAAVNDRANWTVTDHVERLRSVPTLLGVEDALSESYRRWPEVTRDLFGVIADWPAATVPTALTEVLDPRSTGDTEVLVAESILQPVDETSWAMHDLVAAFGRRRAVEDLPVSRRSEAWERAVAWYVQRLQAIAVAPTDGPHVDGRSPVEWWRAERTNMVSVADALAPRGMHHALVDFGEAAVSAGERFGDYDLVLRVTTAAGRSARALGHTEREAGLCCGQAQLHRRLGHVTQARRDVRRGLRLLEEDPSDTPTRARLQLFAGVVEFTSQRYSAARRHLTAAQRTFEAVGDKAGRMRSLANLGIVEKETGNLAAAAHAYRRAIALIDDDDAISRARLLGNLGELEIERLDLDAAVDALSSSAALNEDHGALHDQGVALAGLAWAHALRDDHTAAIETLRAAYTLAEDIGDDLLTSTIECRGGDVQRVIGNHVAAKEAYERAIHQCQQLDADYTRYRAREGLAMLGLEASDPLARTALLDLLDTYQRLGLSDVDRVRRALIQDHPAMERM
ncbi:hypothetical protein VV02_24040 [Luteipulveratus mongoliensis]|uniref:Uncharacterized protein n=2 Tax=Luteipulveratus mongoliensis TaxID=571913 RepID=A0A0K1JNB9_9MICO|nr:hypothetical protein VV02_24040 [Luteipulveratus mongoliensis]